MPNLIEVNGLWWPSADRVCREAALMEVGPSMAWLKDHNPRWGTCIQAGGNGGVFPLALSALFRTVLTFEPDRTNYDALQLNTMDVQNVIPFWGALGDQTANVGVIEHEPGNCGAHRVEYLPDTEAGSPCYRIDKLMTKPDLIWLDVEGFELQALKGAAETIGQHKPMVITEEKRLGRLYGYEDEAISEFLGQFGYSQCSTHAQDRMYTA